MGWHRKVEDHRRLQKLYDETQTHYGHGVYFDRTKNRLIQYWISSHSGTSKLAKRFSNKKVRRNPITLQRKRYKKLFDYWWTMT